MTPELRSEMIFAVIDSVSNDTQVLRQSDTPQAKAINWLIHEDGLVRCPNHEKLIQRWAVATIYYSTNGDGWYQCSNKVGAIDDCGNETPFMGDTRFLAPLDECLWAGIICSLDFCVTEIEFGECWAD
jgi:hypothetical protein